jgi:hypothetical protein
MKKATKLAILARYESQLADLDQMIDLNLDNAETVKNFQKQYRQVAKLLTELLNTKADDE